MLKLKKNILILTQNHNVNTDKYNCIYIGPWCKEDASKTLNWMTDSSSIKKELEFIETLHEKIVVKLAKKLNIIHNTTYSNKYWRILLSSWLFSAIGVFSDRINALEYAFKNRRVDFILMQSNLRSFIPKNSYHFLKLSDELDEYNQYLFSRILEELFGDKNIGVVGFDDLSKDVVRDTYNARKGLFGSIIQGVTFNALKILAKFKKTLVSNSAIDLITMQSLFFGTNATPFIVCEDYISGDVKVNKNKRVSLFNEIKDLASNQQERAIIKLISEQIPVIFLEDYCEYAKYTKKKYNIKIQNIITSAEIYNDSAFTHFMAISKEKGARLLGMQHGGNYGIDTTSMHNIVEMNNYDFFYTWGEKNSGYGRRSIIRVMPSIKLMKNKIRYSARDSNNINILYTLTSIRKYVSRQNSLESPYFNQSYMGNQNRFISTIDNNLLPNLIIRNYDYDRGWNYFGVLEKLFPGIRQDNLNQEFIKSLSDCKLYVVDHLATTWIESLSLNKPTIMFWNDIYDIDVHIEPYLSKLSEAGILHATPELAAEQINEIYKDLENWWMQDARQEVVKELCDMFAYMPDNPLRMWRKELKDLSEEVCRC